jgi:hypothetical protein
MHRVRRLVRTPIARLYERYKQRLFHRSPEKIRQRHAWCANSMLQVKKNATPSASAFDDGISICAFGTTLRCDASVRNDEAMSAVKE